MGLVISLGIYVLSSRGGLRKILLKIILIASGVIVALVLMAYLVPSSGYMLWERLFSFLHPEELGVLGYRLNIWAAAFEMWKSSPILGVGLSNFPVVSSSFTFDGEAWGGHSVYVVIICELGLIGFLIWGAILFNLFKMAINNKKYMILMLPLFTFLLVISLKGTYCWLKFYWLIFGLIDVSSRLNYLNIKSKSEDIGESFNYAGSLK